MHTVNINFSAPNSFIRQTFCPGQFGSEDFENCVFFFYSRTLFFRRSPFYLFSFQVREDLREHLWFPFLPFYSFFLLRLHFSVLSALSLTAQLTKECDSCFSHFFCYSLLNLAAFGGGSYLWAYLYVFVTVLVFSDQVQ